MRPPASPPTVLASIVATLVAVVGISFPAAAYERPGSVQLVSRSSIGVPSNGDSPRAAVSDDGRFVAFESSADNLVSGDTNGVSDVFVFDSIEETVERVSVGDNGVEGDRPSSMPDITPDGRFVAFLSDATTLADGNVDKGQCANFLNSPPASFCPDVFVHDRASGTTERISVDDQGNQAAGYADIFGSHCSVTAPSITDDGRFVVFPSLSSTLVTGDSNGTWDVFVRDRAERTTRRVSLTAAGGQGGGRSCYSSISGDGTRVAFASYAPLVSGDSNNDYDVFVRDLPDGAAQRVSVGVDGEEGNAASAWASISADGRFVAFSSYASNLVPQQGLYCDQYLSTIIPHPGTWCPHAFVRDLTKGTTELVGVTSAGELLNTGAIQPIGSISADGRFVVGTGWLHDRETKVTEQIGGNRSYVSGDGRFVAIIADDQDELVHGDTNGVADTFLLDRGPALGAGEITGQRDGDALRVHGWATFSGMVSAEAIDPSDDGGPGAAETGGEILEGAVIARKENKDILLRLRLEDIPRTPGVAVQEPIPGLLPIGGITAGGVAGVPIVVYGFSFSLNGAPYEVRATRLSAADPTADPDWDASFALYRCDSGCELVAPLAGGFGTTGEEIRIAVPLAELGIGPGDMLGSVVAFAGLGENVAGAIHEFDSAELGNATIPEPSVQLGISAPDASEDEVEFIPATLAEGVYEGALDVGGLEPGVYHLWARTCLQDLCEAKTAPVSL